MLFGKVHVKIDNRLGEYIGSGMEIEVRQGEKIGTAYRKGTVYEQS